MTIQYWDGHKLRNGAARWRARECADAGVEHDVDASEAQPFAPWEVYASRLYLLLFFTPLTHCIHTDDQEDHDDRSNHDEPVEIKAGAGGGQR